MVGFIQHLTPLQNLAYEDVTESQSLVQLLGSPDQQVKRQNPDRLDHAMENYSRLPEGATLKRHHDQQVNIRIGIWLPIGPGTEENDFFRLKCPGDDCTETCDLPAPVSRSGKVGVP